jgi:hypothetical protein
MWSGFLKPFDPQTFSLNVMPLYACHLFYIWSMSSLLPLSLVHPCLHPHALRVLFVVVAALAVKRPQITTGHI